jgi:alpha-amylase
VDGYGDEADIRGRRALPERGREAQGAACRAWSTGYGGAMLRTFAAVLGITAALVPARGERPWNEDVIYFALTDRFYDGDPENNVPAGSDEALHDAGQKDISRYHGGDLRGLEKAIASGYFEALGVTALWVSPPVRNVWKSAFDLGGPKTGYHGYWTQDFLDVDPHIVSRRSLDGSKKYADSRDGRMQHYKDFVALAHARGLKVVQDIVCNHAGPVFYYDSNENGQLDREREMEWQMPYRADGPYEFTKWMSIPEWNAMPTMPGGPVTVLGRPVRTTGVLQQFSTYGRRGMSRDSLGKRDGEEVMCDFFALRDVFTDPKAPHFSALVDEFVEIYRFYVEEIGVDGFRVDTVKHVHREFWEAFTDRLREKAGPERAKRMILFGEIYDWSPYACGRYTYRAAWPARKEPCLDSVLNFNVCFTARQYLRHTGERWGSAVALETALKASASDKYNPTPGADGLNARQKMVNFIENHDGLNRFRVAGVSERHNLLANSLLLTLEGIPCLYYGTEAALLDSAGNTRDDSESGRMTFIPRGGDAQMRAVRDGGSFREIAAIIRLRRELPVLTRGEVAPLWVDSGESKVDDGIFAFARVEEKDGKIGSAAVVVFNAGRVKAKTAIPGNAMRLVTKNGSPLLAAGQRLVVRATIPAVAEFAPLIVRGEADGVPTAEIMVPAKTAVILTIENEK